ncbi:hypothetical protein NPIL_149331 [Nephila pilipes]|uniref:Uncharacterized protein n=1 Tax=Nephila pilipes TaxID=299642 RepID=A0A8X6U1J1_NEPPI|nr:hypothetical protein NPIL_149331 [Nephila pilipes]
MQKYAARGKILTKGKVSPIQYPGLIFPFMTPASEIDFCLPAISAQDSQVVESLPFSSVLCKTENLIAAVAPFSQLIVSLGREWAKGKMKEGNEE